MAEWTAFDEPTASVLREKTEAEIQTASGDALTAAMTAQTPAMAVLPSNTPGKALLVSVSRQQTAPAEPAGSKDKAEEEWRGVSYIATGFLGLGDEPVYEEQQPPPKKSWWKRLTE